jgi:MFS family permease
MRPEGPSQARLTFGLVFIISIYATDTFAIVAAMPVIEADLGGRQWYGAVFSIFVLANIIAIVATSLLVGKRSFSSLLSIGLVIFAIGVALGAAAPSMFALTLTRAVQGAGTGVLATITYAVAGCAFDDRMRPKVLAAMSTAFVVPSLVAPAGAAWLAETVHWRWVFAGLLVVTLPAAAVALPLFRQVRMPTRVDPEPGRLGAAVGVAAAVVFLQAGLAAESLFIVIATALVGLPWMLRGFAKLLPAGSLTGSGVIGGSILSKLLAGIVFLGTDTFIPLALTDIHGHSATVAGLTLTAASLTWAAGSWTVAHKHESWGARSMNRFGHGVLAVSVLCTMVIATGTSHALLIAIVAWSAAGFGVGLVFGSVNVVVLREAPDRMVGAVSASLQLSDVMGFAIATGFGGVLIAVGDRNDWHPGSALLIWWGVLAATAAIAATVAARDLPTRQVVASQDSSAASAS